MIQRNDTPAQPATTTPEMTDTTREAAMAEPVSAETPASTETGAPPARVTLPPKIPLQIWRETQSNIPSERAERDRIKTAAVEFCQAEGIVPPVPMTELREHASAILERLGMDPIFVDYTAVLISNESWRETLAQVPFERRLLLMPKCLRIEEHCPAPFDQFGLLCKECGLCSIENLGTEAERLGYAVLVAEGSAIVRSMIETGKVEAVVGVSCLNVLERSFPHMEAGAVPGMAIPLLQDDCVNTNVDLDQVWDIIHLTSDDKTYRLDLDALKEDVKSWFTPESIDRLMGPVEGDSDRIARDWLARDGKRWRPYLTACVVLAHQCHESAEEPELTDDLRRLCLAVECFHKASLIHDDIEDDDKERYGEEALFVEHGLPVALNVGDLLLGEGYRLLSELDVSGDVRARILATAAQGHVTLSRGQGAELWWTEHPKTLTSLEVLDIFRQKTAPAFEVALLLGALFVEADAEELDTLKRYSESLGIAYQIKDDLEDYTGESDSNDLADLRPSLLLAIAHKRAKGTETAFVESLWRREIAYADGAVELAQILEERGVVAKARELRDAYEQQAVNSLRLLDNATLKGLLRRVIGKIFGDKLVIEGHCGEFEAKNAAQRESN